MHDAPLLASASSPGARSTRFMTTDLHGAWRRAEQRGTQMPRPPEPSQLAMASLAVRVGRHATAAHSPRSGTPSRITRPQITRKSLRIKARHLVGNGATLRFEEQAMQLALERRQRLSTDFVVHAVSFAELAELLQGSTGGAAPGHASPTTAFRWLRWAESCPPTRASCGNFRPPSVTKGTTPKAQESAHEP